MGYRREQYQGRFFFSVYKSFFQSKIDDKAVAFADGTVIFSRTDSTTTEGKTEAGFKILRKVSAREVHILDSLLRKEKQI